MSDRKIPESGRVTRRRALQAVGAGSAIALAGCLHEDKPCDLSISKEHAGGAVTYGDTTEFEISVCNEGDEECPDPVTVTDDLPAGTTFDSVSGTDWTASESGGVVTCEHPNSNGLGGGDCLPTLTLTIEVGQPSEVGPEIANCAAIEQGSVTVEQADRSRQKNDCVKVPVEPPEGECDLAISKEYDGEFITEGSAATFQIEVCNEGEGVCPDSVTVVDSLPAGVTFDSVSGTGWSATQSGGSVVATHPNSGGLDPGECLPVLELTVNVGTISVTGDAIRNCVGLRISDANAANNRDCIDVPIRPSEPDGECELSIEKDVDGEFQFGGQGTYVLTVCNDGDEDCSTPLVINDTLPTGITFDSVTGDWDASVSGSAVTLENDTYGPLAPGECLEIEMIVNVGDGSQITSDVVTNCAVLSYDGKVDRSCVQHPIVQGDDPAEPGECDIDYNFNSGYDIVTGTTFSDGDIDNSWFIYQDTTNSGMVPRTASIVDMSVVNARWGGQFTDTRWISHKSDAQVPSAGQTVVYRYTFCLHEDFHDPDLSLRIHAEDVVADIRLNGTSLMFFGDGQYQDPPIDESYTDPQLFQVGANELEIEVVEDTTGEASGVNIQGSIKAKDANCECGNH